MRSIPYFRNYGNMPLLSREQTAIFLFQEEAEVPSGAGRLAAQVVEDSPQARVRDAFLFDACRIKEQGRCRVSIGSIDGVLIGVQLGNEALRICMHHLTSFQAC